MAAWQRAWLRTALAVGARRRRPLRRDGQVMDRHQAALLRLVERLQRAAPPPGAVPDVAAMRAQYRAAPALTGLLPDRRVRAEAADADGVPARRYLPPGGGRGTLVWFHGGGFVMGDLDTHDPLCRALAAGADRCVLSVAYRLAPEHPFPAAVDDALRAWRWAVAHEPGPHLVGGDSAGGNLAAVIAQVAARSAPGSDRLAPPAFHALLYPVVDMLGEWRSVSLFGQGFLLTEEGLQACAALYMPPGTNRADPRLSPLRGDLAGLSPALVVTAGFDPLRDQGPAYAAALRAAGVPAAEWCETALVHGFADVAGVVPEARRAVARFARHLRGAV